MRDVDVLVVGGGPAGLASAIVCARAGLDTVLCEKDRFPVDNACGEGLMPTGWAALHHLGVAGLLDRDAAWPLAGIRYIAPSGHEATARFAEGPGRGIRRTALSAALWRRAQESVGLEIIAGASARPVARAQAGAEVRIGHETVRARLLIGADGRSSAVRRWAGLDGPPGRWQRWGARRHFCLPPWSDYVEVIYSRSGVEAYVTPTGRRQVNVAILWHKGQYVGLRGGVDLFPSLLAPFPRLRRQLAGAAPMEPVAAVGPLQRRVRRPVADGVLLVGDAAGYLDAITGEGLSLAFESALALEETVVPLLVQSREPLTKKMLAPYASRHAALVQPYYQMTTLALFVSRIPALADRVIRALEREPDVFQALLSANMGRASLWSPRLLARLFRSLLYQPVP